MDAGARPLNRLVMRPARICNNTPITQLIGTRGERRRSNAPGVKISRYWSASVMPLATGAT